MNLESILKNCHDVYMMECTDELETYTGMIGNCKYLFNSISYPKHFIEILGDGDRIMYYDNPEYIKSVTPVYKNKIVIQLILDIDTGDHKYGIVLGVPNP